ncbi:hypothetical protein DPMN_110386 [Dreissena polymorpha]|uniref:Uncharacterized protein n=1 Tax=Dreissena polymorpha TaxID=45954 RepID=A0A9D4KC02_DREPO|nr:hypothetical protein DPMN_110386 [Dreissena polymorpha]
MKLIGCVLVRLEYASSLFGTVRVGAACLPGWWLLENSRYLKPQSLVFPRTNMQTFLVQFWYAPGPILAFESPWTTGMSFLGTFPMIRSNPSSPCLRSKPLMRRPA